MCAGSGLGGAPRAPPPRAAMFPFFLVFVWGGGIALADGGQVGRSGACARRQRLAPNKSKATWQTDRQTDRRMQRSGEAARPTCTLCVRVCLSPGCAGRPRGGSAPRAARVRRGGAATELLWLQRAGTGRGGGGVASILHQWGLRWDGFASVPLTPVCLSCLFVSLATLIITGLCILGG
jgi:hypothetical protein